MPNVTVTVIPKLGIWLFSPAIEMLQKDKSTRIKPLSLFEQVLKISTYKKISLQQQGM